MSTSIVTTDLIQTADSTPAIGVPDLLNLLIAQGVVVSAQGASAPAISAAGVRGTIAGQVFSVAGEGINSTGDVQLTIEATGSVYSTQHAAVYVNASLPAWSQIVNLGVLSGWIGFDAPSVAYMAFTNSGTITGVNDAYSFSSSTSTTLVNTGMLSGIASYHSLGTSNDSVVNSGVMDGRIFMGAGQDSLDAADALASVYAFGEDGNDVLIGSGHDDSMFGGNQDDLLRGNAGDDYIGGDAGNDTLEGGLGADTLDGGANTDTVDYRSSGAGVSLNLQTGEAAGGAAENDTLTSIESVFGSAYADNITGSNVVNRLRGGGGNDTLDGLNGNDTLFGGYGSDSLLGGAGIDSINGGNGNDTLVGGAGRDTLDGGDGRDRFVFLATSDSGPAVASRDTINGYENVDRIDLSAIDANAVLANDQAFTFVGTAAFSATAGELRFQSTGGTTFLVQADVNGDGAADFSLQVNGIAGVTTLHDWNFVL